MTWRSLVVIVVGVAAYVVALVLLGRAVIEALP